MNLNIMIPDDAVSKMLSTGRCIQGSITLANAKEGNFHPHHRAPRNKGEERTVMMLKCGKAVATREKLSLRLNVRREFVEFPVMNIMTDCKEASEFFEEYDD